MCASNANVSNPPSTSAPCSSANIEQAPLLLQGLDRGCLVVQSGMDQSVKEVRCTYGYYVKAKILGARSASFESLVVKTIFCGFS